jgi:KipI family sensor histidine kinase inhibitor
LGGPESEITSGSKTITIPVCYDTSFGLDLKEVSGQTGLSAEEIIKIHTASLYRVFMLGFTPGFPYLGETDARISCSRKETPRQIVPEGSVGLAGRQTGIYPVASPGGWQIIGRTPLKIFNPGSENIFMIWPGDRVLFKSIDLKEFETLLKNPALWKE